MRNKFMWLIHNCISHPLMGIIGLVSDPWANWVHDLTVPSVVEPIEDDDPTGTRGFVLPITQYELDYHFKITKQAQVIVDEWKARMKNNDPKR